MLGAIHGDLLSRPRNEELTPAEMRERERRHERVRRLLRSIARPADERSDERAAA